MRRLPFSFLIVLQVLAGFALAQHSSMLSPGHSECGACHVTHAEGEVGEVLTFPASTDALCLKCHQDPTESADTAKAAQIPVVHQSESSHIARPSRPLSYKRSVKSEGKMIVLQNNCLACHDAHGRETGKLTKVYFDSQGEPQGNEPSLVAGICFGCHAGSEAVLVESFVREARDVGTYFGPAAVSSHRVGQVARDRPDLPSLLGTISTGVLDCTSCHSNSDPGGLKGPHVSSYPDLLKAPYFTESDVAFVGRQRENLCYTCHRRESVEGNQSFPYHAEHIRGFFMQMQKPRVPKLDSIPNVTALPRTTAGFGQPTPCATCHDPHGSLEYLALIRFDPQVVMPSSVGGPYFHRRSPRHGTCTLLCHGYDHVNTTY